MNKYFGYGSNMNQEQMNFRCPDNKFIGKYRLYGWEPCFPQISARREYKGVLGIKRSSDENYVEGLVYELSKKDIESLDWYEGVKQGSYKRTDVKLIGNDEIGGFVYESCDKSKTSVNYIPSYVYLTTVLSGLLKENMSNEYILNLMRIALNGKKPSFMLKLKKFLKTGIPFYKKQEFPKF